ncbi:hypothetical protein DCAR_0832898 [Daucus carota subsp. sativus]|uniref:TCP domain-containing protein n=1 Tax=Daucus carota subsp. sativus TaxID=79200 RepID=A0A175YQF9_DAUCS|nr:PREDICTED: transcription factor CYCLOIDEA [Daucus carota subsp. sativus]WOH13388.1 hypothetical protein DCAR_0832898 [Daucus carota subsp. sativus]
MSWISNSIHGDKFYNGSPFVIPQEEEALPFFQNFVSPLYDDTQLFSVPLAADEISNVPLPTVGTEIHQHSSTSKNESSEVKRGGLNKGSVRRSGKKDRHTKIKTARGVRDRRMRLSLQIARKFFDLQDRLGFDKASKTIEWLFSKSKKAINQLSSNGSHLTRMSSSTTSTGQKGSKSLEISEGLTKGKNASGQGECEVSGTKETKKSAKHNAKDLRDKARARARERTWEKKMNRCLEKSNWSLSDQVYSLAQLGPAGNPNPLFDLGQESMSNTSSQDNLSTSQSSIHHHLANMELLGTTTSPSGSVSCSMYGYDHEKNGDLFSGGLDSYSNNLSYLGWDISAECLNPNSTDHFLESSGKIFGYFDQNQVD